MRIGLYLSPCAYTHFNDYLLYIHKSFFHCRKFTMDWISLLIMIMMNLGFSLSNFQRMGESLCLELVKVQYVYMILEQTNLASEFLLTWYYILFSYNWLLILQNSKKNKNVFWYYFPIIGCWFVLNRFRIIDLNLLKISSLLVPLVRSLRFQGSNGCTNT